MRATIVKGPHVLFQGANGTVTYGITIRSLLPRDAVEARGYRREWDINDYTIINDIDAIKVSCGLTAEAARRLYEQVMQLLFPAPAVQVDSDSR